MPLLKIELLDGQSVDLSLYNNSGVKTARHMRKTLPKYPAAIPVILALKSLLKQARLDDASIGGLGGYALTTMVLAHCMHLRQRGRPDIDYGDVLRGFLETFGYDFDLVRHAVSMRRSEAIVKKSILEKETLEWIRDTSGWQGRTSGKPLLFVEDPLTGRNLARSSSRFLDVQRTFRAAFNELQGRKDGPVLPYLIDIERALHRGRWPREIDDYALPMEAAAAFRHSQRHCQLSVDHTVRHDKRRKKRRSSQYDRRKSETRRPRAVYPQTSHLSHRRWTDMTSRSFF